MKSKESSVIVAFFVLGVFLYIVAALTTFKLADFASSKLEPFLIIFLTSLAGLGSLALGYGSVILFGGAMSLRLGEFVARITRSSHVVEVVENPSHGIRYRIVEDVLPVYVTALVFIISVALGWNVHNVHDPRAGIFHPLLHAFDIFSKNVGVDPVLHSVDLIPNMVILVLIAGIAPAIAIPYFRKFKITGVNSGPFHTYLLLTVVGLVAGVSVVLTLIGFIYNVLWMDKGPEPYHYILLAMLGLSLHYAIGAFLARERSEAMVKTMLEAESRRRVTLGTINIQRVPAREKKDEPDKSGNQSS